jgi:hypothetical protein
MENINWMEKPSSSNLIAKIGAAIMLILLVGITFAIPSIFMMVFMHHTFMMQYYVLENVMVLLQKIDQGAKSINENHLKDGKLADNTVKWAKPIIANGVDQLVSLGKEMKSPVDINDLSTEEEKYEKYKFSVETAVGQGNVGRLKSFYRNKEVMKYADLAELVNSALPEEAEEAPKVAKTRTERKYF